MVDQQVVNGVVGLVSIILIAGLSVTALKQALGKARLRRGYDPIEDTHHYEDEDGAATEDSIAAYSDLGPKIAVWLSVLVGLGASIAVRILLAQRDFHSNDASVAAISFWSDLVSWVLLFIQSVSLPMQHEYQSKFRLTVNGLLSALVLLVSISLRNGYESLLSLIHQDAHLRTIGILQLIQLAAALSAVVSFGSFPRRPDVFERGKLVDQEHTTSLVGLFSFSWNRIMFSIAKERQMKIDDIPSLSAHERSRNLQAEFLARKDEGRLWWRLVKAYSGELAFQWTLTLAISFLALFPQVVLFNFLERIETRQDHSTVDPALFIWVMGLCLSQLLQVGVGNYLKWTTSARLEVPVASLLQALVFNKALKLHETATPGEVEDGPKKADKDKKDKKDIKDAKPKKAAETRQSVINHMKLDSNRVIIFCSFNNYFPLALFKLILAGGFLIQLVGWIPFLAGFCSSLLIIPVSSWMSKIYGKIQFGLMKYRDGKAHLLTEALQGMRQLKFSALEDHWEKKILKSRNDELQQYWKVARIQAILVFIINAGPLLLSCVTFVVYAAVQGTHVKASVIFTALGLFNQLDEAVAMLPILQVYLVEAWTSCARLEKFFDNKDKEDFAVPSDAVVFENATVCWPRIEDVEGDPPEGPAPREPHTMLRDINLAFPTGKLSVIAGKTGSGKSLLLAAILGEVKLLGGTVKLPSASVSDGVVEPLSEDDRMYPAGDWIIPSLTAFVSQTPWVETGTVRENILFGLPFDEKRYGQVLQACALQADIELLVKGDRTKVGPKGVTLSGGQRWRVALARALYSRAGIVVLDDVLSAVDAHVGRRIVEALTGDLARNRTRILATHHSDLVLPKASYLVRLHEGKIESAETLTPEEQPLSADVTDLAADDGEIPEDDENGNGKKPLNGHKKPKANAADDDEDEDEEKRETGRVKWGVYKAYFLATRYWFLWLGSLVLIFCGRLGDVAETWSLKELTENASAESAARPSPVAHPLAAQEMYLYQFPHATKTNAKDDEAAKQAVIFWLSVYVAISFIMNFIQVARVFAFFAIGLQAAKVLFERMTHTILRAPLRWIDTVPSGRILNRFTTDTFTVDRRLASDVFMVVQCIIRLIIVIATSLAVSPYIILFGLVLLVLYTRIAKEYITVAREMKRINSVSNSPIYDQFSSVLSGLSTIRAFHRLPYYMSRMFGLIDNNTKASWGLRLTSLWMSFRMGMLGALFVTAVATAVALGSVNAALAGFSLTFALGYTGALTALLQAMTSVELGFNAAERVVEYAALETEPEGGNDAPAAWPTEGRVEIDNLTVAYNSDLPPVLKNLNLTFGAGERVGIIGRTGAGKSTFAAVLFRLLEPREGSVRIDNIDIASLKLVHLRSRLAIIPQDPFLFSGTLRSNLDIEELLDDHDINTALQRVHLVEPQDEVEPTAISALAETSEETLTTETVLPESDGMAEAEGAAAEAVVALDTTLANAETNVETEPAPTATPPPEASSTPVNIFTNLYHPISTGGSNLSQGQRQLVCLARAILSRPKIVVLDEATSAVDRVTDAAIQESLRKEFAAAGCTVLVIAHRLSTVADFDKILVLDKGRVAEFGTPRELLEKGMAREKEREREAKRPEELTVPSANDDGASEGESATAIEGRSVDGEVFDGTGAFWELVQKSAEKEKLLEMILGETE